MTSKRQAADLRPAFYDLYNREATVVLRYLRSTLRDRDAAEDLCADTFCHAWDAWPRFHGGDTEARVWLIRIARNLVIDNVRRDGRLRFVELSSETAAAAGIEDAQRLDLRHALAQLNREDRELLGMRMAGLSHAEIAQVRHRSEEAIKKSWQRVLSRIRKNLEVTA